MKNEARRARTSFTAFARTYFGIEVPPEMARVMQSAGDINTAAAYRRPRIRPLAQRVDEMLDYRPPSPPETD